MSRGREDRHTFYHFVVRVVSFVPTKFFDSAQGVCTEAVRFWVDCCQLRCSFLAKRCVVSQSMVSVLMLHHGVSLCLRLLDNRCDFRFAYAL